jgi:hypothetical protein
MYCTSRGTDHTKGHKRDLSAEAKARHRQQKNYALRILALAYFCFFVVLLSMEFGSSAWIQHEFDNAIAGTSETRPCEQGFSLLRIKRRNMTEFRMQQSARPATLPRHRLASFVMAPCDATVAALVQLTARSSSRRSGRCCSLWQRTGRSLLSSETGAATRAAPRRRASATQTS